MQDPKERLGLLVRAVDRLDLSEQQALLEQLEWRVQAGLDLRVPPGALEDRGLQVQVLPAQQARWVPQVPVEVPQGLQDLKVPQARPTARQVTQALAELQAQLDRVELARLELRDRAEQLAWERRVLLAQLDRLDRQAPPAPKGLRVQLDLKGPQDPLAQSDLRASPGQLVPLDPPESLAERVQSDRQE